MNKQDREMTVKKLEQFGTHLRVEPGEVAGLVRLLLELIEDTHRVASRKEKKGKVCHPDYYKEVKRAPHP